MRYPKIYYIVKIKGSPYYKDAKKLLEMVRDNLSLNYGYNATLKKGRLKIEVRNEEGDYETLPEHKIKDLFKIGLDIQEIRYMKDLNAEQLFSLEAYARRFGKTFLPIETLKNCLKLRWLDAPYTPKNRNEEIFSEDL